MHFSWNCLCSLAKKHYFCTMRTLYNRFFSIISLGLLSLMAVVLCLSCSGGHVDNKVNAYNDSAYYYHYISLEKTLRFASLAYDNSPARSDGRMEALNNLAFVDLMKMNYKGAEDHLMEVLSSTDNQFERLVANVQMMRLCQRESRNKEFYDYYWQANRCIERINEVHDMLSPRDDKRFEYAQSELSIILAAYLYYVEQIDASRLALSQIDEHSEIQQDTAQLLNYYYNVGSGGYFTDGTPESICIKEFDYLVDCFFLARSQGSIYWEANALQAMSEHLADNYDRHVLLSENVAVMKYLNVDNVEDSLLAGNMAQRSVELFAKYGDVYQTAGALRTLSDRYHDIGDYGYAITCLHEALERDTVINQAPALTSSIYEKLSINYSAIDDKQNSDIYRNFYLDSQWETRQDRELEARAEQFGKDSLQQNVLLSVVCIAILLLVVLLYLFTRMRRDEEKKYTVESFLEPLETWKKRETEVTEETVEKHEMILEEQQTSELILERNLQQNIEQRAKMALVNSITPFIDRMLAEIQRLQTRQENADIVEGRYAYILELTDKINEYNGVLTDWIQLRKGELSLKIESFRLQDLFDIAKKSRHAFSMKGVELVVGATDAVVKADRTLTLFMINTIADNARKATSEGGRVAIDATETPEYVEISISDTGMGMSQEDLANVFNHQPSKTVQHGFGLMNCKGIIEKYKKVSSVFSVCNISAESEKGKGSTFRFRLPRGVVRSLIILVGLFLSLSVSAAKKDVPANTVPMAEEMVKAKHFCDTIYYNNLQGNFQLSLAYADSACTYFNKYYKKHYPKGTALMRLYGASVDDAAELKWLSDSLTVDYNVVLDMRNEAAVAALALHQWDVYKYNNKVYSRLFRERSADPTLMGYVSNMKAASETKYVALILLLLIFLTILPAYYLMYYRHKMYYRVLVDRLGSINEALLNDDTEEDKLDTIRNLWKQASRYVGNTKEAAELSGVVNQICAALEDSINVRRLSSEQIEMAEDELHRLNYEIERLHVNNNVLDNCFSTLKHETMYYPSRIRQLVDSDDKDIANLYEITAYYKELYTLLSLQAQHQVESSVKIDANLMRYLQQLLKKVSGEKQLVITRKDVDATYDLYIVEMPNLKLNDEEVVNLFTPQTSNLSCMIIRQIIREIGETTNHRGCGVYAVQRTDNGTDVMMTLSKKVKFNV